MNNPYELDINNRQNNKRKNENTENNENNSKKIKSYSKRNRDEKFIRSLVSSKKCMYVLR